MWWVDTIQSELCKKDLGKHRKPRIEKYRDVLIGVDILAKAITSEEAVVRKAGGKFRMNPLFPSTVAKIKAVRTHLTPLAFKHHLTKAKMLEQDQPVRDGVWTTAEIELINEKALPSYLLLILLSLISTLDEKMSLITTKPTIYLVNLTMKDYLRQKSKYLPTIAAWVTSHGGLPKDVIPFSIEFEEKAYSLRNDPDALKTFLGEGKVKSRLEKIITEGTILASSLSFPSISIKASDIKK